MTLTWTPFSQLPVGSTFEIPGDPPIRVKINADTACWHADWIERKGQEPTVREGAAVYHHGNPWEMVLATDPVMHYALADVMEILRARGVTGLAPRTLREYAEAQQNADLLRETDEILTLHFGQFRRQGQDWIPDLVKQLIRDNIGRKQIIDSLQRQMQVRGNNSADLARENAKQQTSIRTLTRNAETIAKRAEQAETEVARLRALLNGERVASQAREKKFVDEIRRLDRRLSLGEDSERTGPEDRRVQDSFSDSRRGAYPCGNHGRRQGDEERGRARIQKMRAEQ